MSANGPSYGSALRRLQSNGLVLPPSAWRPPKVTPIDPDLPKFQPIPVTMGAPRVTPKPLAKYRRVPTGDAVEVTVLKDLGRGPIQMSNLRIGDAVLALGRLETGGPKEFLSESHGSGSYEIVEGRAAGESMTLFPLTLGTDKFDDRLPYKTGISVSGFATQKTKPGTTEVDILLRFPSGLSKKVKGKWVPLTAKVVVGWYAAGTSPSNMTRTEGYDVPGHDDAAAFVHRIPGISLGSTAQEWIVGVHLYGLTTDYGLADSVNIRFAEMTSSGPKGIQDGHAAIAVRGDLTSLGGDPYLSSLNLDAQAELRETIGGSVVATRNPAAAYLDILQGDGNPEPLADARIDSSAISAWATACTAAGLTFDFTFAADGSAGTILDALRLVSAAGLARPIVKDGIYSVLREPTGNPVALFTPANMAPGFKTIRTAFDDAVHALRCTIENRAQSFRRETFVVYASGYSASNATRFEDWTFDGTTTRSAASLIAAYHLGTMTSRSLSYRFATDGRHLRFLRGDLVRVAHPRIGYGLSWGWVTKVPSATSLVVSRPCPMSTGGSYGIRIQNADGTQVTKAVTTHPGEPLTIHTTAAHGASVGDHFAFGTLNLEALSCVVLNVEHGSDRSAVLTVAPEGTVVTTGDPWGGAGSEETLDTPKLEERIDYSGGARYSFL